MNFLKDIIIGLEEKKEEEIKQKDHGPVMSSSILPNCKVDPRVIDFDIKVKKLHNNKAIEDKGPQMRELLLEFMDLENKQDLKRILQIDDQALINTVEVRHKLLGENNETLTRMFLNDQRFPASGFFLNANHTDSSLDEYMNANELAAWEIIACHCPPGILVSAKSFVLKSLHILAYHSKWNLFRQLARLVAMTWPKEIVDMFFENSNQLKVPLQINKRICTIALVNLCLIKIPSLAQAISGEIRENIMMSIDLYSSDKNIIPWYALVLHSTHQFGQAALEKLLETTSTNSIDMLVLIFQKQIIDSLHFNDDGIPLLKPCFENSTLLNDYYEKYYKVSYKQMQRKLIDKNSDKNYSE